MRMRTDFYGGIRLSLSGRETAEWAHNPETRWRGSTLAGRAIEVELSPSGDLLEVRVDGSYHADCSECELRAIIEHYLATQGVWA